MEHALQIPIAAEHLFRTAGSIQTMIHAPQIIAYGEMILMGPGATSLLQYAGKMMEIQLHATNNLPVNGTLLLKGARIVTWMSLYGMNVACLIKVLVMVIIGAIGLLILTMETQTSDGAVIDMKFAGKIKLLAKANLHVKALMTQ
jgi:predicted acyltransferase (DUF342 family)